MSENENEVWSEENEIDLLRLQVDFLIEHLLTDEQKAEMADFKDKAKKMNRNLPIGGGSF
ncbi:hypothetical protein SDC9_37012 [bioreactor metagenome]|mgnify:FL=1|uniref:Uncharacterized protein n=1 Tax=bioreactor metagenome TaxID=1076179 RepID=A0A644VK24_9ZZZZ|nr:hypothetical protein [Lentimicrobium sp.]MEA5110413.1 hypothetical protein [Lentimicrobium sp.]